jgi:hypothetical protein
LAAGAALLSGAALAQTPPADEAWTRYPAASEVRLTDVAAVVRVLPQMREDVSFVVVNPGGLPNPEVRVRGDRLEIDGRLARQIRECHPDGSVTVRGEGRVPLERLPVIYVRTPADLVLSISGGGSLETAPAETARIAFASCGDAEIGPVNGALDLAVAGSGDVVAGPTGSADVRLAGSGDVILGPVAGGVSVSVAGSGDVAIATVNGPTRIALQGSGDVLIGGGRATELRVAIAGSGDVQFDGVADSLTAAVAGSGDVRVADVTGAVVRRVAGSGAVTVQEPPAPPAPPTPPAASSLAPPPPPPAPPRPH